MACRFGEPIGRRGDASVAWPPPPVNSLNAKMKGERTMMHPNKHILAAVILMAAASAAGAQEAGNYPAGPMAGDPNMACRMDEHIDGQLAYIKAELKITAAQEPQWNVFAQSFRDDKEKQARTCKAALAQRRSMMSASLPKSMKIMENNLAEKLDSLRSMEASVEALYANLSKAQKKTADEIMKGAPGA